MPDLPRYRDAFIGREEPRGRIEAWLEEGRPVQVVGPGGVGKTRVAVEVAAGRRGGLFADLSAASTPEDAMASIAETLRTSVRPDEPFQALIRHAATLGERTLVLDNAEHLVATVSRLVRALRDEAPQLRILCTSRTRLDVDGMCTLELEPLDPDAAVELLLELVPRRAIVPIHPGSDRPLLRELARDLSGLPLALELAARRLELLALPMLIERIRDRPDVILSSAEGGASMWGALDRSMSLLTDPERSALAQLTVFRSSIPLDAAEAVVQLPDAHTVDALHLLVRHSLLQVAEPVEGMPRFRMLEVVRQHAGGQLARDEAEDRHADFYLRQASRWSRTRRSVEHANLAAIRDRALGAQEGHIRRDWAVPALAAMMDHLEKHYTIASVIDQITQVLQLPDHTPMARADLLEALAHQYRYGDQLDQAISAQQQATSIAERAGDTRRFLSMSGFLANLYGVKGERARAVEAYRDLLSQAKQHDAPRVEALAGLALASSECMFTNDWRAAEQMALDALEPAKRAGPVVVGRVWHLLSECSLQIGDVARGLERIAHALDTEGGDPTVRRLTDLLLQCQLHLLAGDDAEADRSLDAARAVGRQLEYAPPMLAVLEAWRDLGLARPQEAFARLQGLSVEGDGWIADRQRGLVGATCALARAALGDAEGAELMLASASDHLVRGNAESAAPLRPALRALATSDLRDAATGLGVVQSVPLRLVERVTQRVVAHERAEADAWWISDDGTRARHRLVGTVDLSRRAAPARILAALLGRREADPEGVLTPDEVFAAGWPGQSAYEGSKRNRVYVAMNTLRKAGLGDLLQKVGGGYRLDPSARAYREEAE